jgi:hypothetical protein
MRNSRAKTVIRTILLILISIIFIYFRIPRDVTSSSQAIKTAFVLSLFVFFLSAPCFYLIFRTLFGQFLGLLFFVFYILLALFPYKLFYGPEVNLSNICFYPVPTTIFGASGIWVVIFYFVVSVFAASAYWFYKTDRFFPAIEKKQVLIFLLLLLAAIVQICPRLGENSPKSIKMGLHRENAPNSYRTLKFYGVETGGYDAWHHIGPSGIFKGTFEVAKGVVINRRGLTPYLYSLISTYFHPYYGAIILNGVFYYIIIVAGYLLAKHLGLSESIAITFSILLSANYYILFQTIVPYFYIQYVAFTMLIVLLIFRLRIFETPRDIKHQLLFCFVLACSGLTYDPFVFSGVVLLWGFFHSIRVLSISIKKALGTIAHTAALGVVPIFSQYLWEVLLRFYDLQGMPDNLQFRVNLLKRLVLLPKYIYSNFWQCGALASRNIIRIIVENPVFPAKDLLEGSAPPLAVSGETSIEYWPILGLLGVFSFFVFLHKYVRKENREGLYACYISNLSIAFISSLAAAVPPLMKYHWIFLAPSRTNNAYPVLILAQSIAIFHIVKFCCNKFRIEAKTKFIVVAVAVCIYILSFVELLFL